jgi:hypothetical protein
MPTLRSLRVAPSASAPDKSVEETEAPEPEESPQPVPSLSEAIEANGGRVPRIWPLLTAEQEEKADRRPPGILKPLPPALSSTVPYNRVTGELYSGKNPMRLMVAEAERGYGPGGWAGFRQWLECGRVVRKGEHATAIGRVFVKKDKESGEITGTGFSGARVFHFDQTVEVPTEGAE